MLAAGILVGKLDGTIEPVMAWGWKPLLASIMRHAPEDGPSGDIVHFARRMEADGTVLAATLFPSFPHADTPYTGVSAVVVGDARHGGREQAQAVCAQMLDDGVGSPRRVRVPSRAARRFGRARQGAGARQPRRARAAHRPLRQLRVGRCAGRDGRRRRGTAPGARRRRHRADPRPCRGGDDDRRRRRPARQARAGRPHRHAVDRPAAARRSRSKAACSRSPTASSSSPARCTPACACISAAPPSSTPGARRS